MANPEHVRLLKQGVNAWNQWRTDNPNASPDLSEIDLNKAKMSFANFSYVNFWNADLARADLAEADLSNANLGQADLREAYIGRAKCHSANLKNASIIDANLEFARLSDAQCSHADFRNSNLRHVDFLNANLSHASFIYANLSQAKFCYANLTHADFSLAILNYVNFSSGILKYARLSGSQLHETIFTDLDLSDVSGLEQSMHLGPSSIGIDTLYKSKGKIPIGFLRNAGVPVEVIEHLLPSIGPAIRWNSCFISYSTRDEEFAKRLHSRMREANMRVWFAPEDLEGGKKLHEQLYQAIQIHDRLLLILSENSIKSEWVMTEIRKAREVERRENRRKLFPVRLVDFETLRDWTCFDADAGKDMATEVREYFIPDFSNFKDHDAFEKAFARLQSDLKSDRHSPAGSEKE